MGESPKNPGAENPSLQVGDRIGRYEIKRAIGRGGMGEVYLAEDTLLHRPVAIKRVSTDLAGDPEEQKKRMLGEAQRASSLSDGRIAGVYDFLVEGDEQLLIMEYIPGRTLREIMSEPLDLPEFWDLAIQCVESLQAAHREGLVHRDIKPENIIRTPAGSVRLIDFGIARRFGPATGDPAKDATDVADPFSPDRLLGTPAYMAPEALRGETADRRSDVFALGVVFHEMLAGNRPFQGDTTLSLVDQILHANPEPLDEAAPQTPGPLLSVIQRMLAKNPADRPSSAGELLEDLVAARRSADDEITRPLAPVRPRPRFPLIPVALGVVALALMGGMVELNEPAHQITLRRILGMNVLPAQKHVVVLPAEMVGVEAQSAAFGAGLTAFLAAELMKLTGDSTLQVASPALVRGNDVKTAARARSELGVNLALRTVLEPQGDGWSARQILTDARYDQSLASRIVAVEGRDAISLAGALYAGAVELLRLGETEEDPAPRFATEASGAFAAWLEGMGYLYAADDSAGIETSRTSFLLAGSIDPECPLSATGLGHAALGMHGATRDDRWLEEAEREFRRALTIDDSRPEAHLLLAKALARAGEYDEAAAEYARVLELDPVSEDGHLQLARLWARRGEWDRAEAVYHAAVKARPHAWPAYWWLGMFLTGQGRFEEAETEFRRLIAVGPDNYRGYVNLGALQVFSGQFAEAIETLERALEIKHSNTALSNLATAYFNQRDFDRAILGYQKAVDAGLSNHEIWGNLGDAYFWAPGKREHARPPYEQALGAGREYLDDPRLQPRDQALALAYLANIFPKVDMPDSAAVYLDRALALSPEDYDVHYYAALVHRQLERPTEAMDWLARAIEGGYPRVWIRDSPVFDTWRDDPRFRELVPTDEGPLAGDLNPNQGG